MVGAPLFLHNASFFPVLPSFHARLQKMVTGYFVNRRKKVADCPSPGFQRAQADALTQGGGVVDSPELSCSHISELPTPGCGRGGGAVSCSWAVTFRHTLVTQTVSQGKYEPGENGAREWQDLIYINR